MPVRSAFMLLSVACTLGLSGGLSGCDMPETQPDEEHAQLGREIENARLVLPAVGGNPGALYFTLTYQGDSSVALERVGVAGAGRTELHQSVKEGHGIAMHSLDSIPLEKNVPLKLEPGGIHVMVFDLSPKLQAGDQTQITAYLSDGETIQASTNIQAAGDVR